MNNDDVGIEELLNNIDLKKVQSSNAKTTNYTVEENRRPVEKKVEYNNNTRKTKNKVANKFSLIVMITKCIGYFSAIIVLIAFIQMEEIWSGLRWCIVICIATWFSTLIFEAIAEGLNLLQDIKNKL